MSLETYSDAYQDIFTLKILGNNKYYLDIGCSDGIANSNTFLLEKNGWTGILIDINQLDACLKNRPNSFIEHADMQTPFLLKNILKKYNAPKVIDYISLDVDKANLDTLINFPLDEYRFKFLTFEHDIYAQGEHGRCDPWARKHYGELILLKYGYIKLVDNIICNNLPYEDWYVYPNQFNMDVFKNLLNKSNITYQNAYNLINS